MNALYLDSEGNVKDLVGGIEDIKNRIIITILIIATIIVIIAIRIIIR